MKRAAVALHRQAPPSLKRVSFNECKTKAFFVGDMQFTQMTYDIDSVPIRRARKSAKKAAAKIVAAFRKDPHEGRVEEQHPQRRNGWKLPQISGNMQSRKVSPLQEAFANLQAAKAASGSQVSVVPF
eukprot:TRINITY_DN646_c0_g3_i5.p1 TRINITY_DN646_c0_g3~~TRINITY_DN646_c0_g3_i5.p1  ORF type:complete len:127 (-),score=31.77 TRINITY_DN646_c0_g3_i5:512-892(-)